MPTYLGQIGHLAAVFAISGVDCVRADESNRKSHGGSAQRTSVARSRTIEHHIDDEDGIVDDRKDLQESPRKQHNRRHVSFVLATWAVALWVSAPCWPAGLSVLARSKRCQRSLAEGSKSTSSPLSVCSRLPCSKSKVAKSTATESTVNHSQVR